jgi:hypothetical protein
MKLIGIGSSLLKPYKSLRQVEQPLVAQNEHASMKTTCSCPIYLSGSSGSLLMPS